MADVGQELRRYRVINGITQRELAAQLHISMAQVVAYETGHTHPRPRRMKLIADTIGVPIQAFYPELFGGKPITFKNEPQEGKDGVSR